MPEKKKISKQLKRQVKLIFRIARGYLAAHSDQTSLPLAEQEVKLQALAFFVGGQLPTIQETAKEENLELTPQNLKTIFEQLLPEAYKTCLIKQYEDMYRKEMEDPAKPGKSTASPENTPDGTKRKMNEKSAGPTMPPSKRMG